MPTIGIVTTDYGASSGLDRTFAHTVDAGNDRLLLVATGDFTTGRSLSGVTYAGVALTLVASTTVVGTSNTNAGATFWALVNPPVGTDNVVVTTSSASTSLGSIATNVTGVHQTTPYGTPVTNSQGTNVQPTISVPSAAGDLVVDALYARNNPLTVGTGQTLVATNKFSTNPHTLGVSSEAGTGSPVTMSWTVPTTFSWQTQVGVALKPANTGPITVSGSDSVTASTSEAGVLSAALTGSDASTVSLTESGSVTSLAAVAGSDTITASTTETGSIAGTVSGADAATVDAAATATSSTALAGPDTVTIAAAALPTATATLTGTDSPTVSTTAVSDVSTITTAAASDTVTVSTTETALVAVGLSSGDTVTAATSEVSSASATLTSTDTMTVSAAAQPAIAASVPASDAATVSTTASTGIGVADTPAVSLTETRSIAAAIAQSQALTITLVDTPGVATTIPATDSATVSLSATGSVQTITLPDVPRVTNVLNRSGAYAVQIALWRADRYGNRLERVPVSIPIQGALDYNEDRDVKRKLSLTVNSPHYFTPFSDFVIPEITLTDASGTRTTRQMGHYLVTPPNTTLAPGRFSGSLEAQDVTFLLQRDTLPFALNFFAGVNPGAGARGVAIDGGFSPAQLVLPDTGFALTTAMHFDAGTSRLKVINDLYNAANWYAVWMDGDGVVRTMPYQNLQTASPKQTYSTQGKNVQLIPPIGEQPDWSRLRNRVTVRSISPDKPTIFGMAEIVNPNHPLHRDRIGMVLAETFDDSQVTTNADAGAKAALLLSTSASYYRKLAIETVVDLDAGAHDIIGLDVRHREVTYDGKWFRRAWTMQLKGVTARTSHDLFRVESWA